MRSSLGSKVSAAVVTMLGVLTAVTAFASSGGGGTGGAQVPLPASLVLLTTGVAALVAGSRWFRRK